MNKLNWEKFKPLFGTWADKIQPFFLKGGFDSIYTYLKEESKRGVQIAPNSNLVYRCFQETDINNTYVIIISMCPYHSLYQGSPVADGLAFSCSVTGKLQPSLISWYEGIENDLYNGLNLNYTKNPDLSYLAKNGVLLYNCALTTTIGKAGNHIPIWENFTKYLLEEVFAYTGIPIIFIGKDAQKYNKYVSPLTHGHIFNIEHPSFAARNQSIWDTKGAFSTVNRIIRENNGNSFEIDWLGEKNNL